VRKFINQYGYIIAIVAVVIALIAIWFGLGSGRVAMVPTQAFYVDELSGDESLGDINGVPPLTGKTGKPTLCKAMKYTCDGGKTKTTYMLIKFPPHVQQEINSLSKDDPVQDMKRAKLLEDYWVRGPAKDSQWVPVKSPKGQELTAVPACPDGKPGQIVYP